MFGLSVLSGTVGAGVTDLQAPRCTRRASRRHAVTTFAKLERTERLDKVTIQGNKPAVQHSRRELLAITTAGVLASPVFTNIAFAEDEAKSPEVTRKVFFDITVDGVPKVNILVQSFRVHNQNKYNDAKYNVD
eukprot:2444098-Pyramimonas_sp.AAC.1